MKTIITTHSPFIYTTNAHLATIMAHNYHNTNMSGASLDSSFDTSDFFDWFEDDSSAAFSSFYEGCNLHNLNYTSNEVVSGISNGSFAERTVNRDNGEQREIRDKVAFRTKSEIEILDDGFKWRKYGKKMVKNSPNPRNYYKCSVEGCSVKKRVERDKEDRRYVVTTYEGIHNHEGPTT